MKVNQPATLLLLSILWLSDTSALIIPDELPSILSLIYSNIPTLKKGTDSRLGWGFRLGDRADFQVLVELGPQTNTQPLGNQGENANNKRDVALNNLVNTLYAKRERERFEIERLKLQQKQQEQLKEISNTPGGDFLNQWSNSMGNNGNNAKPVVPTKNEPTRIGIQLGVGEVDAKQVIPDDSVLALEELYHRNDRKLKGSTTSTVKPENTTSSKDALDNVSLD